MRLAKKRDAQLTCAPITQELLQLLLNLCSNLNLGVRGQRSVDHLFVMELSRVNHERVEQIARVSWLLLLRVLGHRNIHNSRLVVRVIVVSKKRCLHIRGCLLVANRVSELLHTGSCKQKKKCECAGKKTSAPLGCDLPLSILPILAAKTID